LAVEVLLCTSLGSNFLPLAGPPDDLFTFLAMFSPNLLLFQIWPALSSWTAGALLF
jgi:hypothetical protein